MINPIIYRGVIIQLVDPLGLSEDEARYMLIEEYESDYLFRVICISGYHSGQQYGFIKESAKSNDHRGCTVENLLIELETIFPEFDKSKVRIYDEHSGISYL